jgi:lipopolysaccharide biosynthesis glycosyltransferase
MASQFPPSGTDNDILRDSEQAYAAGDLALAERGYQELARRGAYTAWTAFALGRIARDRDDTAAATAYFRTAMAQQPDLIWARYELIALLLREHAPPGEIADAIQPILATNLDQFGQQHIETLEQAAHRLWDRGNPELATEFLLQLWPTGWLQQLGLGRLVERGTAPEIREEAADRLLSSGMVHPAIARVMGHYLIELGRNDDAMPLLEQHWRTHREDFDSYLLLVRHYAQTGQRALLHSLLAWREEFDAKRQSLVNLHVAIESGEAERAAQLLATHRATFDDVPEDVAVRLAYMMGERDERTGRDQIIEILRGQDSDSVELALVELNSALADHRWHDALALFQARLANIPDPRENVRLARLDVMAFNGMHAEAADLLALEALEGRYPPVFRRAAIRILAELGRWGEVFEAGLDGLAGEDSFDEFHGLVVRAARALGRETGLLDALLALPRPLLPAQLRATLALTEDLAAAGDDQILARLRDIAVPPERLDRIAIRRAPAPSLAPRDGPTIFYCADGNYLKPALVSLTSLCVNNPRLAQQAGFALVLDSKAVDAARPQVARLARRLGIALELVDAASIVPSQQDLRTNYGLFTGGRSLASSAYYRIFFARFLAGRQTAGEALYIDADTLVRAGLDPLFELPLDQPLMARADADRAEVRYASILHGLQSPYFNSGVLRMDLADPQLIPLLDAAIEHAQDPQVELVYHDQCALNRAFNRRTCPLPDRFNYLLSTDRSGDAVPPDEAVILHFLDRPKPWDSMYGVTAREWFSYYRMVQALIAE